MDHADGSYRRAHDDAASAVAALHAAGVAGKAVLSERGWVFLVGDTNQNLLVQFGLRAWTDEERRAAADVLRRRADALAAMGAVYRKLIVPEKSVVYRDYLPHAFRPLAVSDHRPACCLARDLPDLVVSLERRLVEARSYGLVYFRGDTHPNWLGAWFMYRAILEPLIMDGLALGPAPFRLAELDATLASFDGDLLTHFAPDLREEQERALGHTNARYGFELTVRLGLPEERRAAFRVPTPPEYAAWFGERETLVYERSDGAGPRVVVFRDSTLDFCHDLIAQHFARSVFVWRQGMVFADVIERESPDLVLHVMAERFVIAYPGHLPLLSVAVLPAARDPAAVL